MPKVLPPTIEQEVALMAAKSSPGKRSATVKATVKKAAAVKKAARKTTASARASAREAASTVQDSAQKVSKATAGAAGDAAGAVGEAVGEAAKATRRTARRAAATVQATTAAKAGLVEDAKRIADEANLDEGAATKAIETAEALHYDVVVNKRSLSVTALTATLNERWENGWAVAQVFEQRGNTVIIFEKRS